METIDLVAEMNKMFGAITSLPTKPEDEKPKEEIWDEKEEGMCQNSDCENFPENEDNIYCNDCLQGFADDDRIGDTINEGWLFD
jgi:hypothetical protein